PDRHALPPVVEPAPARDAVDVAAHLDPRQGEELLPGPAPRTLDQPEDSKIPLGEVHLRDRAMVEHRPFVGEDLAGRESLPLPGDLGGIGQWTGGVHDSMLHGPRLDPKRWAWTAAEDGLRERHGLGLIAHRPGHARRSGPWRSRRGREIGP